MKDWRDYFARRVEVMRRHGAITSGIMCVVPYTPETYARDVMFQVMQKMRDSVNDEHYEASCVDGVFSLEIWKSRYEELDTPEFWAGGERAHYIESAYQDILALHPLKVA